MYRVGQNGLFLRDDNFAKVTGRKECDISKVLKFCLVKKYKTHMSVNLNFLCLVIINVDP